MNDEERNKIKEAVQTLRDFVNSCGGCYTSCLIAPNGSELHTDWGYVWEGLNLIEYYAENAE